MSAVGPGIQIGNNNVMYVNSGVSTSVPIAPVRSKSASSAPFKTKRKIVVPDKVVDTDILQLVSCHIGKDWLALGRQLQLTNDDLDALQLDYSAHGQREMAYQMLREWHERCGADAKLEVLAKALIGVKRSDIAMKLSSSAS
jgi:hypothetical protein